MPLARVAICVFAAAPAASLAPPRVYFDLAAGSAPLGRLEFALESFDRLPRLTENLRLIASNERAPRCTFDGQRIAHAAAGPNYKWAHSFEGAGNRPAIDTSLLSQDASSTNRNEVPGGTYYGVAADDGDVVLTTPLTGPGAKKARYSVVRLGASPSMWKQRLLINSAVLGVATDPERADAILAELAALSPDDAPRIEGAGIVAEEDGCLVPAPDELETDDCLWDASQEAAWRDERFRRAEKEGFRDPARGNSGTVR